MVIVLPEDPAIPLLSIYPKDVPTYNRDMCAIMFIGPLFINLKTTQMSLIKEWMQKCGTFTLFSY